MTANRCLNFINTLHKVIIIICVIQSFIFSYKISYGFEFYEVDSPYKKKMSKKYTDSSKKNDDYKVSLDDVNRTHEKNLNELYAEQLDIEKQDEIEKMERASKRRRLINNTVSVDDNTQMPKRTDAKSFLDKWIVIKDKKPMDVIGPYTSLKLMLMYPMQSSVRVEETTNTASGLVTKGIFSANAEFHIMPSFFIAVGSDQFKVWRWEFELGYLPILAGKIKDFQQYDQTKNLNVSKKDLSVHLMTLGVNNYYQRAFFDDKLVGFIGLGIGIGYGWSMGSTIGSDFVMPIVKGSIGFSMLVNKTAKLNIAYTLLYSMMKLPSKYTFIDSGGGSSPAIRSGTLDFGKLIINGISIEYQFCTL